MNIQLRSEKRTLQEEFFLCKYGLFLTGSYITSLTYREAKSMYNLFYSTYKELPLNTPIKFVELKDYNFWDKVLNRELSRQVLVWESMDWTKVVIVKK